MLIPMIVGAALGMAVDYNSFTPKDVNIFDQKDVAKNKIVIEKPYTRSQYRVIESSSETTSQLDISGDLAMKARKGAIDLAGSGKYLTQALDRTKMVEMLITVNHETVTETFPSYIPPRTDWQSNPQDSVGTHYVRSVTWGGQLLISYKIVANRKEDMEEIKAAVTANIASSGSLDVNVTGKMEKLSKAISSKSSVEIDVSATIGAIDPPSDMQACLKLVENYPTEVKKYNEGKGAPLKVDIVDLATLQPKYPTFYKNPILDSMLAIITDKYDDCKVTWDAYLVFEKEVMWDEKYDDLIDEFQVRLNNAKEAFTTAISNLDTTKGLEQFDEPLRLYALGGNNMPNKFAKEFDNITHTVLSKPFFWFPYTTAVSSYVHWGSLNCSLPSPEPLYVGYAATSPIGFGNGGNVECLPSTKPILEPKKLDNATLSEINGLRYELPNQKSGQVVCSFCRLENATIAYTIAGRLDCPGEMKLEYSGYLMTSRDAGTGSSFVCLDKNPVNQISADSKSNADEETTASLSPVWTRCPDCDKDENQKYVACVVCSR